MEGTLYFSPHARYTITLEVSGVRKRIQWISCAHLATPAEHEALQKNPEYRISYCLDQEYPTVFAGKTDKNPKLLKVAMDKLMNAKSEVEAEKTKLADDNAQLRAELEAMKKGSAPKSAPKKDK